MRISDWSSDVCSSDLSEDGPLHRRTDREDDARREGRATQPPHQRLGIDRPDDARRDRKSVVEGKSVSVRVDLGGRRSIKKKTNERETGRQRNSNTTDVIYQI